MVEAEEVRVLMRQLRGGEAAQAGERAREGQEREMREIRGWRS